MQPITETCNYCGSEENLTYCLFAEQGNYEYMYICPEHIDFDLKIRPRSSEDPRDLRIRLNARHKNLLAEMESLRGSKGMENLPTSKLIEVALEVYVKNFNKDIEECLWT